MGSGCRARRIGAPRKISVRKDVRRYINNRVANPPDQAPIKGLVDVTHQAEEPAVAFRSPFREIKTQMSSSAKDVGPSVASAIKDFHDDSHWLKRKLLGFFSERMRSSPTTSSPRSSK